jgi:hypothetical protein
MATGALLAPNPVPTSNPLQGGQRRYVRSTQLLRNVAGAGAYTTNTVPFTVRLPSTRLLNILTIGFRPDTAEDAVIPNTWTLALNAWARTDREAGGFLVRGNGIIPGPFVVPNILPISYEAVTGVDEWRGIVTVPLGGTTLEVTGNLWLTVSWEPAAGESQMPDAELEKILKLAQITGGGLTVFGG